MKICFFGSYNPGYSRNKILIDGLQKNGASIVHCKSLKSSVISRYPELIKRFIKIHGQIEVIYVAFVGHLNLPLAWILGKVFKKKVVFDMYYSMYDTYIFDRKSNSPKSLRALCYWFIDWMSVLLSDVVILDTASHITYITELLKVSNKKFKKLFVGGDDSVFYPRKKKRSKKIIIEFHGFFSRLQGVESYIEAAKKFESHSYLKFWLIGGTSHYKQALEKLHELKPTNLEYMPMMSIEALAKKVALADISVGHLGTTKKAACVISNKMYHALATGISLIAIDTPATRELLSDEENALFCKPGNSKDLVVKIRRLVDSPLLRSHIAKNGYLLHGKKLTNLKLGKELLSYMQ